MLWVRVDVKSWLDIWITIMSSLQVNITFKLALSIFSLKYLLSFFVIKPIRDEVCCCLGDPSIYHTRLVNTCSLSWQMSSACNKCHGNSTNTAGHLFTCGSILLPTKPLKVTVLSLKTIHKQLLKQCFSSVYVYYISKQIVCLHFLIQPDFQKIWHTVK